MIVRFEQIGERFEVPVTVTLEVRHHVDGRDCSGHRAGDDASHPASRAPVRGVGVNEDDAAPVVFVR